jgi:hypothetical protein
MTKMISAAAFELAKLANGANPDTSHPFYMSFEKAQDILDLTKTALKEPLADDQLSDDLKKSVTLSTGVNFYDLRAPSLLFQPTITPIRNSLKRTKRPHPGDAARWRTITGLTSSPNLMGWVPEGRRAGSISYTASPGSQPYATIGTEDSLTDEAKLATEGFEDEEALIQLRSLYKMMQLEENSLLHGNASVSLGTPTAPTLSAATLAGATLPALTYSVIVVALTHTGYQQAALATGVVTSVSVASNDGQGSFTVNGGASNKSANATQAVTLGQALTATTPIINGAAAYAWYVGAAGSETLQAITTVNKATFSAPLAGSRQAATVVTADYSTNTTAFDGIVTQGYKNSGQCYINALTAGATLTSNGNGEVTEISAMCRAMWDQYRVGVTKIYVSSQELDSITKIVLNGASAPLLRFNNSATADGSSPSKITAGAVVGYYFNKWTADGGQSIPIILHPNMTPGTIFGYCEQLPASYMSNETPTVAEVLLRQDYYVEKWPRTARAQFYGTYCQEAVAVYAPFCLGIITNITPS